MVDRAPVSFPERAKMEFDVSEKQVFPILTKALEIRKQRQQVYGASNNIFECAAESFTAYIRQVTGCMELPELSGKDVAMLMSLFKVHRAARYNCKPDDFIDICGYAELAYLENQKDQDPIDEEE